MKDLPQSARQPARNEKFPHHKQENVHQWQSLHKAPNYKKGNDKELACHTAADKKVVGTVGRLRIYIQHLNQFNDGVRDGYALHITQRLFQLPEGIYILSDYRPKR
ncbi:uncharacterized protein ARMOST_07122 [Armillaria ostoyae]|uniref:Uncharacterized protein n=1 Tax=Armillaria ostoyae TaxID=47428 RepID=A0A284R4X9_ARMOS|nr:uncharacterized protein ARMOST_07122 [Armillaria ostoyae]